jgi:hypothetical protein
VREGRTTRAVTFSDISGRYHIPHVTGRVTVRAGARGYASAQRELVAEEGARLEESFSLAATGEPGAPPEADLPRGSITADLRDGQTLGPLLSFQVTARGPGGQVVERAGTRGELELGPLSPGRWTVTVEARGYASRAATVEVAAGEPTPLRVELTQGATIGGTVYSRRGEPVAGAEVTCGLARGKTNRNGDFRLAGVPAGDVVVRAAHPEEGRGELTVPLRNGDEALTLELRLE